MRVLTSREKILLISATTAVALGALVHLLILPPLTSRQNSLAQLIKYETVSAVLDRLPARQAGIGRMTLPPLRQRVTDSARRAGLDIRRLDPQGVAALSVSLDDVPFAALIGWMEQLTETSQVHVLSAEVGRRPEPGIVSARFLLEAN